MLLGAGYLGFTAWEQSHWWLALSDYSFGWLVPLFVVFVVHDRWPSVMARLHECAVPDSPRAAGWQGGALTFAAYAALVMGAGIFLVGAASRAAAGAAPAHTLAISVGASALLLATLFVSAPEPEGVAAPAGRLARDARVRLVALFVFPALVWLVSAPLVSVVQQRLSLFLLGQVTRAVFFTFDTLGLVVDRQGNVLVLPEVLPGQPNQVGVAEACSGIRSFTACLFAGSFLAAVFLDRFWKKISLVLLAVVFAFGMNIMRALFLTAWAYNYGESSMEQKVHDIAGYAVLGLTVAGLLGLLPLFNLKLSFRQHDGTKTPTPFPVRGGHS
ncbi:MAG: exosortase/archaeosortase family protein [Verrucomicrobiota bacterium]